MVGVYSRGLECIYMVRVYRYMLEYIEKSIVYRMKY